MAGAASGAVSPFRAGLLCRCPHCGQGRLYQGFLTLREACSVCGTELRARDTGDGPAVFIVLIVGFIVVALALIVETAYAPPLWLHALLWLPLILGLSLGLLRPFKATFYALQQRHKAGAG